MNKDDLKKIKYDELKNIAKDMDITISKSKDKLIDSMIKCFEEYQTPYFVRRILLLEISEQLILLLSRLLFEFLQYLVRFVAI